MGVRTSRHHQRQTQRTHRLNPRTLALITLSAAVLPLAAYLGVSAIVARKLAFSKPLPIGRTPASLGLDYRNVAFLSRDDGVVLRGWLIPGIGADGEPTLDRTVIAMHGAWQNRTDPAIGLLDLCGELARAGFAVLALDMRGHGESEIAPFSLGYAEQRDVLGAVDFLRGGPLPYRDLARPRWIGGYGISMGGHALLYAAAHEPVIRAVAADSAYAEMLETIERELPQRSKLPRFFTRGVLFAARALFGVNIAAVRPVETVAAIAPRPLLLIQGGADEMVPTSSLTELVRAAEANPAAHVITWRAPNVPHAQAFHREREAYVSLLIAFLTASFDHEVQRAAADADQIAG
jgi:uncharacterized protein